MAAAAATAWAAAPSSAMARSVDPIAIRRGSLAGPRGHTARLARWLRGGVRRADGGPCTVISVMLGYSLIIIISSAGIIRPQ